MSKCVVRMEEPETCGKCPLSWYDGAGPCFCMVSLEMNDAVDDGMMWKEVDPNKKPSWCPVICQLPEGHGRMVDAETLRAKLIEHIAETNGFYNAFNETPTIVPAERSATCLD